MIPTVKQRSQILRFAIWLVVSLAVLTVIGLVFEWINYTSALPGRGLDLRTLRLALLAVANLIFTGVLASVLAIFLWTRVAHTLPDLQGWHLESPASEFRASDATDAYTFDEYLAQESRVFEELDALVTGAWAEESSGSYNRFNPDSICNPESILGHNWNRTQVMEAENPVGGVLLLHGLSDSPYSLRVMGQRLHAEGYTVIWLRVPGHGTNPRALAEVSWGDWTEAVRVAMQGLRERVPKNVPLILGGYSNGGALSVHYALTALEEDGLPRADAIVLFSPMIGINPLAKITRLYNAVSLVSRNEKTKWSSIFAEIDPFKYSSWPMNANVQAWAATQGVERRLAALAKAGRMSELPPVLAMQSVVDSTVVVPKLITVLFDRLESEASELFLFDINRVDKLSNLVNLSFEKTVLPKLERTDRPFRLTVLRNADESSEDLLLRIRDDGAWTQEDVDVSWPVGVISLSHVAVPFPPNDPVYGDVPTTDGVSLGTISMRAEPNALMIPSSLFVRCRQNPFYDLMEDRVVDWLSRHACGEDN
ncbi:MAG: alpha/beta hydrolase [Rubripirellula sp.]